MAMITGYNQFEGRHWETGTLRNVLAQQGVKAPHTGKPLSEALLFGISGGVVAGYFTFEYTNFDPWLHFLTRNTFDPLQTVIAQLGIKTQVKQTDKPDKAVAHLTEALDAGKPAIVVGDLACYPYFNVPPSDQQWFMLPVVVYGYEDHTVYIADRAKVGLTVTADELAKARARTSSNKHRLRTLDAPDLSLLPAAVEAGLRSCVSSFLDAPPRAQMKGKYGLAAFTRWADLLADTKTKNGWAKAYSPVVKLYSVLRYAYHYIHYWGTDGNGSRGVYADFLDEAAVILNNSAFKALAGQYRALAGLWDAMTQAMLPDHVPPFKEARELMQRGYGLFIAQGGASLAERQAIGARLRAIRDEIAAQDPLTEAEAAAFREHLREQVLKVHDAEQAAVLALRDALGELPPVK